jgi:hypothetical protein
MDGSDDAHCSLCRTNITPRLSNISKHEESAKHKRQANLVSHNSKISLAPRNVNDHIKEMELQLALAITCHTSIMAIDHLGEIMVNHGKGSSLEHLKLHRTKCSLLIKEVIAPALYRDLCEDMAGQKYCVILDESTDVSCNKLLCVIIRFYSKSEKKIVTALLSLIPVIKATGKDLFQALKGSLENAGLSLANCVGYASDGASVMVGGSITQYGPVSKKSLQTVSSLSVSAIRLPSASNMLLKKCLQTLVSCYLKYQSGSLRVVYVVIPTSSSLQHSKDALQKSQPFLFLFRNAIKRGGWCGEK